MRFNSLVAFVAVAVFLLFDLAHAEGGLVGACKNKTIDVVQDFKFPSYLGKWYEIGHSKSFFFDHGCEYTTAEYSLMPEEKNMIKVNNTCFRDGKWTSAVGKAKFEGTAAHLEVSFFLSIYAPYDVVEITEAYDVALVVSCSEFGGSNLWILARKADMPDNEFDMYVDMFKDKGFKTDDFERTVQK
eukprot:TRINITY_DN719_c0_g1_i1.p2 TRINITY_DN719_c0_g1~~TRINITY_DN719_c0_g1_i1.p2  ORF type:complete len:186 (-),score=46.90 TRINITY_DN719_c0_g1_i1:1246-1803(-)